MSVHFLSPFDERSCIEKVTRTLSSATIESDGGALIFTAGRYQIRLALEGWGGPQDNPNRFGGIRSEVSINSTKLHESEEAPGEALSDIDYEKLGEMVRVVVDALQPIQRWRDDRGVSSLGSL